MTKNNENGAARHGSTASSDSWRSNDTIKASSFGHRRGAPVKVETEKGNKHEQEVDISPNTNLPGPPSRGQDMSKIAPWDQPETGDLNNHRRAPRIIETGGTSVPTISQHPPSAVAPNTPPWAQQNPVIMPTSVFGSFFNDSSDEIQQLSPGIRPGSSSYGDGHFPGDDRRPSIASATTVSSTGSKNSVGRGFHKKLQNVFGEEFHNLERKDSEISLAPDARLPIRDATRKRNNSSGDVRRSRPSSPFSRPRTPTGSSEVTPWEYQDSTFGKDMPAPPAIPDHHKAAASRPHHHRLHLPGHRHTRSKEEPKTSDFGSSVPLRPSMSREDSTASRRTNEVNWSSSSATSSRLNLPNPRPQSPTPSTQSSMRNMQAVQRSPEASAGKRSLLDKITGRGKGDKPETLKDLSPSTASLQSKTSKTSKIEISPGSVKKKVATPTEPIPRGNGVPVAKETPVKKEHKHLPFKHSKKAHGADAAQVKDPNEVGLGNEKTGALWNLDTDLSHMEGIVNHNQKDPKTPPAGGEIFAGWPSDKQPQERKEQPDGGVGAWDAPDSWGVKRVGDDVVGKLRLIDDRSLGEENTGPPYCIRIFRSDTTFATLSVGLYTTVAEIIQTLGKKSALADDIDSYHILMRKHDTSRQLEPQERPLLIQKQLLMQAGYTDSDRIEDIGREDNSYLCRFTFLPNKMTGYSSFEKDPGFNKTQKLSHVDLQGRNLITIPIALYQKATEIILINLSRNLNLDIPTDFIQACTNLREIRYTSNEAWSLPRSLSLASRLSVLDVSNNRLEQLEHAELHKLQSLQAIRLSNNKLSQLPKYFGSFKFLRSLNVSSNSLTEFPEFLCDIKTLVDLDVSFNSISCLPDIANLTNLERFGATNNKLSGSFPDTMKNLTNLNDVDVRFNRISNIDVLALLPKLDHLDVGHNAISAFEGAFQRLRKFKINHNPVTRFGFTEAIPTLSVLDLKGAKLSSLPDDLYMKMPNLTMLHLDKNHFGAVSAQIGRLTKLEHLSIARNDLSSLPAEIGRLTELRYLDVRENNLNSLPSELWYAKKLETLNVSSNVLSTFPKPGAPLPPLPSTTESTPLNTPAASQSFEELGPLGDFAARRPSQASGYLSVGSSPGSTRKGSVSSGYTASGRKPSIISRTDTQGTMTPISRKDSSLSSRIAYTFAGSLRHLLLADNRLSDDVFDELALLPELRILNLSYNFLIDIPPNRLRRWQHLTELYLSGNDLSSMPAEELEEISSLKVLLINSNKFQVLPAELSKVQKLAIMDVASNLLKYNVSNWPYDWNWNWNHNLKYLNLSGNKRLQIKPGGQAVGRGGKDLTDFTSLTKLRILGLMDVTLMVTSVPDQTEDRRVRTAGSSVGTMAYGMADSLGRNEHLSTMDLVFPRFRSHDEETIVGIFDGQSLSGGGSKIAYYLHENFKHRFADEMDRLRPQETPQDALRRTFLGLNKDLASAATQSVTPVNPMAHRPSIAMPELTEDDLQSGCVATILYIKEMDLFVANCGDAEALLISTEGSHRPITRKHDPAEATERQRIRDAGGYVSRHGKLNDAIEVSRAFGYFRMAPAVVASPYITQIPLRDSDEMVLLASRELWDYLTPDFAVDVARSERGDLMRAAQKLRDLAIAFGATGKIMVMLLGVSDLRKRERARYRTHSMSMGPSGAADELFASATRRGRRGRDAVADSKLARLDQEVDAPTGDVSLVFTDIKNSTLLWETYPKAMQSAIRMHNELMRRQLRIIGGYEVKTEGDAFMVAFPTVTSALLWCFTMQQQLLDVAWPEEILSSIHGQEVMDADNNVIFRGLSVRMGIHWGQPVCEVDPVTKRMDYFGPMVNRASRISSVADGGQITVSSDFIAEIQRLLETHIESDRSGSTGSEETLQDDLMSQAIRRELRSLSSQGFEVKDLGERRLKGLENPEYIYLMYPHSLASRLIVQQQRAENEAAAKAQSGLTTKQPGSQLTIDTDTVWELWNVSLRLEMLCSTLEDPTSTCLKPPETSLLERMKNNGGEVTDRFMLNFVEHQISRIESCVTSLALRNMVRPFKDGMLSRACPMADIFGDLASQLEELKAFRQAADFDMAPS